MPYRCFDLGDETEKSSAAAPENEEQLRPNLMYITQSVYHHDWPSVLHTHYFAELFYVLSGEGNFLVEGKSFPVKTGDLILINPNVLHTEQCSGDNRLEYIVLGISNLRFFDQNQVAYDYSKYHFSSDKREILFLLQAMIREASQKEEHFHAICQNYLDVLLLFLQRDMKTVPVSDHSRRISRECRFVEEYIDGHFSEDITLETLSSLTYMNKFYLVHAFKKYKGVSPINYLIDKRIQEAKHLLETTDFSIAKIAQHVGFSSQSYFSQMFRKMVGIAPVQYKKQYDKNHKK